MFSTHTIWKMNNSQQSDWGVTCGLCQRQTLAFYEIPADEGFIKICGFCKEEGN